MTILQAKLRVIQRIIPQFSAALLPTLALWVVILIYQTPTPHQVFAQEATSSANQSEAKLTSAVTPTSAPTASQTSTPQPTQPPSPATAVPSEPVFGPTPTPTILPNKSPTPSPTPPFLPAPTQTKEKTPTTTPSAAPSFSPTINPLTTSSPTPSGRDKLDLLPTLSPILGIATEATAAPTLSASSDFMPSASLKPPIIIRPLAKRDFRADEEIKVALANAIDREFTINLIHASGEKVAAQVEETTVAGERTLTILPSFGFRPGKYILHVTDSLGRVSQQDFTWGVLAINTNKSIYLPNEKAKISMAVLNDQGYVVCDAKLELRIKNQESRIEEKLSTEDGTVNVNPECKKHGFTLKPDYEATYQVGKAGKYEIILSAQTKSGTYTISDFFEVRESVPFDIERQTATRIYPPETYPVSITITANEDFKGVIEEVVPMDFTLSPPDDEGIRAYDKLDTVSAPTLKGEVLATSISYLHRPFSGEFPISLRFGEKYDDRSLIEKIFKWGLKGHDGIDFALPKDTAILAVDKGTVIKAGNGIYGTTIILKHDWGESYYGHLSSVTVKEGQVVTAGEQVGLSGNTGISTGPHLHFAMKPKFADTNNGYFGKIDPSAYFGFNSGQVLAASISSTHVKVLRFNLSLKKSEKVTLGYRFKAPDISPQFYLLGPVRIKVASQSQEAASESVDNSNQNNDSHQNEATASSITKEKTATDSASISNHLVIKKPTAKGSNNEKTIFAETRQWQIAGDSPGDVYYLWTSTTDENSNDLTTLYYPGRSKRTSAASGTNTKQEVAAAPQINYIDVKPSTCTDGSSVWANEANAIDSDVNTYAYNTDTKGNVADLICDGQTITLATNEKILGISLTIKLETSGFSNDQWRAYTWDLSNARNIWKGPKNLSPVTLTHEWIPNQGSTDGLWTEADFEALDLIFDVDQIGAPESGLTYRIYDISYRVYIYNDDYYDVATIYSTASLDGDVQDTSPVDGNGDVVDNTSTNHWVGDTDGNAVNRGFYSFDISSLPPGARIIDAHLDMTWDFAASDETSLTGDKYPSGVGGLTIDHIDYGASLDASDYECGTGCTVLTSNIATLVTSNEDAVGVFSTTQSDVRWRGITGLASYVQADLDASRTRTQFRLRYDGGTNGTDSDSLYDLMAIHTADDTAGTAAERHPRLTVVYMPDLYWYSKELTTGVGAGSVSLYLDVTDVPSSGASLTWKAHFGYCDGSCDASTDYTELAASSNITYDSSTTTGEKTIDLGSISQQSFSQATRLYLWIEDVSSVNNGAFKFGYNGSSSSSYDTRIDIPTFSAGGPTTDQLLRHGGWFSSGVEQPYSF